MPPVRTEAENYQTFFDRSAGNSGRSGYRAVDDVDLTQAANASNGWIVGWTEDGDWLGYDVNVPNAGTHNVVVRLASASTRPMSLGVSVNGQQRTLQVNNTGGWTAWNDVQYGNVNLNAGKQSVRLGVLQGGYNIDYIDIVPVSSPTPTPTPVSSPTPTPAPTAGGSSTLRVEVENYQTFFDRSAGNSGRSGYRAVDDVDLTQAANASNGWIIGWTENGDWLGYDVNVSSAGTYNIIARVASASTNPMSLGVSVNGQQRTLQVNNTGGWTNWTTVQYGNINLSAGKQSIRLDVLQGGYNLDYIELVPASSSSTPTYSLGNVITSKAGSNSYTGTGGIDTLSYAQAANSIVVNLATGRTNGHIASSPQKPLKILPLGDSNTYGLEKTGDIGAYRDDLSKLLSGNGYSVDFVGPITSGSSEFDRNHAGLPGWRIVDVAGVTQPVSTMFGPEVGSINGWLSTYQPDVALIMLGTNDIVREAPSLSAADRAKLGQVASNRLSALLDQMASRSPNLEMVVSSIAPITRQDDPGVVYQPLQADYNSRIAQMVANKAAAGMKVRFVNNGLTESDLIGDGVHINSGGNAKLGQAWYNSINQIGSTTDQISSIENVIGTAYNDVIVGNSQNNILNGGGGNDILTSGEGQDLLVLNANNNGTDQVTDFIVGQDYIGLSGGLTFSQLSITQGAGGNLYDTWISAGGQQLALLQKVQASSLTSNSFLVV